VHVRPVVTIFSTGDEVVPPETQALKPGQVRDATAAALAALVEDAGGDPVLGGIIPDDPAALEEALRAALEASDVIVISAGSSVGARDETATAVARLGAPGIWCHGLAIKPGKPYPAGRMRGVPVIGLTRQPAFGARGVPADRGAGGPPGRRLHGPAAGTLDAGPACHGISRPATGRLDVVQVKVSDAWRYRCSACRRCCRS
jgi:molybdopterin molybdotransferase